MIRYRINVIQALSAHGYTTTRLRREKLLSESTLSRIRTGGAISTDTLGTICTMLRCQPSDVLENVPTDEEKIKFF